jgi:hypothetical protein
MTVMGIVETVMGPRSKRDKGLPYTYEAWIDILGGRGSEPVYDHYFSNTICGLIDYLDEMGILPDEVRLYGVYRGRKTRLDNDVFTTGEGGWLKRPDLCLTLEKFYRQTRDEAYRGHFAEGWCLFEDRDRSGAGPVW